MKKLMYAIVLLVMTMPAMAGTLFYMTNGSGGKIEFTDDVCPQEDRLMYVLSYTNSGRMIEGCWAYDPDSGSAYVVWRDGDKYRYDIRDMTPTDYLREKAAAEDGNNRRQSL